MQNTSFAAVQPSAVVANAVYDRIEVRVDPNETHLQQQDYFVGSMPRTECDERVRSARHRQFLVRRSGAAGAQGSYVICVNCKGKARNVRIPRVGLVVYLCARKEGGRWSMGERGDGGGVGGVGAIACS